MVWCIWSHWNGNKGSYFPCYAKPSLFVFIENITTNHGAYLFMSAVVLIRICLFFITSSDSSSFVVATLLTPDKEAWTIGKVSWSMTQCFCAMVLFACGGSALVQMASVILGVIVITIILAGIFWVTSKSPCLNY